MQQKQELENALSNLDVNVDLSEYATKDEVQKKSAKCL